MNSKIYRQADSRWGSLPYPTKKYSFAGNGCGCCACTHVIIELEKYKIQMNVYGEEIGEDK